MNSSPSQPLTGRRIWIAGIGGAGMSAYALLAHAWGAEVAPGVTTQGTPGHSIGHTSYVVASRGERVFIQADVTNVPYLFARHPGWHGFFDQDRS